MRITFKQLKKLAVETLSGTAIGHVNDVVIDIDGQHIIQYQVKHSLFGGKEYLISRDQVVRFEEQKMVVYDTALPKELGKFKKESITPMRPEAVALREDH
jgi:sporulation protein YlmC with PRC-barrel domain